MTAEAPSTRVQEKYRGDRLKSRVKNNLITLATKYTKEQSPYAPMAIGLRDNFSIFREFAIWDDLKGEGEIRDTIGSFCAAVHLAYVKAGKEDAFLPLYETPSSQELWTQLIYRVYADPDMREVFEKNAWRVPVTLFPERGIPLQAILSQKFRDTPVRGVDLGAGFNTAFSFINSPFYKNFFAAQGIDVQPVNMTFGLGIDNQERDPDWVRASIWPIEGFGVRVKQINDLLDKAKEASERRNVSNELIFPSLSADITDDDIIQTIQEGIPDEGQGKEVEVVVTSFIELVLDGGKRALEPLVLKLLKEGGIWVNMGEASQNDSDEKLGLQYVKVYEKKDGQFQQPPQVFFGLRDRITPFLTTEGKTALAA